MKIKTRILLTALLLFLTVTIQVFWDLNRSPVSGIVTANNLAKDSFASNSAFISVSKDFPRLLIDFIGFVFVFCLWGGAIFRFLKNKSTKTNISMVSLIFPILFIGCGPPKLLDPVTIQPNETAWVIPLDAESKNGQVKFNSVDYLEQHKVPAKRVMIDKVERSTGRAYWDYEWIPTVLLIRVDRSLVTKEWTDSPDTGTSKIKQGIKVITKDSIKLTVGLTVTANINEEDASTYLYYHGQRKLEDVIDQNVRSFAVAELTRKFAEVTLQQAQTNQNLIYSDLFKDAATAFKSKGVTIQYLGNAEGMHYDNPSIQAGIDRSYTAAQDQKTAQQEQEAALIRNKTKIMSAETEAAAAGKLMAVKEASTLKNDLEIRLLEAQARVLMASNWNGHLPANILPANSSLLLNLGLPPVEEEKSKK